MFMHFGPTARNPRISLRSSHIRKLRLGVSHREVPAAITPLKDREALAPRPKLKKP